MQLSFIVTELRAIVMGARLYCYKGGHYKVKATADMSGVLWFVYMYANH